MPANPPIAPPNKAATNKYASGILHLFFFANDLSVPIMQNNKRFTRR